VCKWALRVGTVNVSGRHHAMTKIAQRLNYFQKIDLKYENQGHAG
jgi:hypothetical protein